MAKNTGVTLSDKINRLVKKRQERQRQVADFDIEDEEAASSYKGNNGDDEDDSEDDIEEEDDKLKSAHYVDVGVSKLRKGKANDETSTALNDAKYTGSVGSRKDLFQDASNTPMDDVESESESESEGENDKEDAEDSDAMSFKTDSEDEIIEESDESDSEQEEANSEDEDKISEIINKETRAAVNKLSQLTKRDAQKGHSILKQTKFFENIVDLRIKLQKLLNLINQLPVTKQSWSSASDSKLVSQNNKLLVDLFNNLFQLRSKFQQNDHITAETPSPSENNKKRSFEELYKDTTSLDDDLQKFRSVVLNKWSTKIQMASGNQQLNSNKFKAINQPTNVQVDNQLANRDRLVKRTRLNRTNTTPFNFKKDWTKGNLTLLSSKDVPNNQDGGSDDEGDDIDIPKNYDPRRKDNTKGSLDLTENPYIFNDEDFYRLLLNDLLDKKLNDASNKSTINGGAEITVTSSNSNVRDNKIKKNIDTKASKGRKLNFSIQDPIAHFETPINNGYRWADEQIDEFFAGLLGQKIDFNESEAESESEAEDEEKNEEEMAIKQDDIQIFG